MLQLIDGTILPTKVLCTPALLPKLNKLARVLGPKGLMPSPRRGTVTDDIGGMIRSMAGTLDWKGDKEGVVRVAIGRVSASAFLNTSQTTQWRSLTSIAYIVELYGRGAREERVYIRKPCEGDYCAQRRSIGQ